MIFMEEEFILSWNGMEQFYDDPRIGCGPQAKDFMRLMRKKGYDRTLRAGQSMASLILSRSKRHGLRREQASVLFWFNRHGMVVYDRIEGRDNEKKLSFPEIKLTAEVEQILIRLQNMPID